MDYYTYAYLREDKTPYYIGKGKGNRIYSKQRTIKPPKDKSRIIFLKQNLTEKESFKHEKYMIAVFGRKDLGTGILHNRTNGGEGTSGYVYTEETLKKMRELNKGENNPFYGKKHTQETLKKMRERSISIETRKKMSGKTPWNKGLKMNSETRKKISESMSGKNNPMYGKKREHTPEARKKMGEASKRYWENKE